MPKANFRKPFSKRFMKLPQEIFREYDIRGLVGKQLNEEAMELLGKGFGTFIQNKSGKRVVVGNDSRESSEKFRKSFIEGLTSTGCSVTSIGLATTPMLYFAVNLLEADAGVSVTASHNPIEFNGIKLTEKKAFPVFGKEIQEIRKIIEGKNFAAGKGSVEEKSIKKNYLEMLKQKIRLGRKKLRVVVDTGNGTAGIVAGDALRQWGCEVIELFTELDSSFPNHLPDPTVKENLQELIAKVKEEKADIGIGIDGDADRIGVVDGKGSIVWADKLLAVFAKEFLQKNFGKKVLFDVKCSEAVVEVVKANGGKPIIWKTGHSLIKSKMREDNILLAGEMSGHIFFKDEFFGFDDAVYAAGRLLRILSNSDKSLSEIEAEIPQYVNTPEQRIDCEETEKEKIVQKVAKHFKKKYPDSITIDGIRIKFSDGWGLVRKSNTQPKLILRFEAKSEKELEKIRKEIAEKLKEFKAVKAEQLRNASSA